MYPMEHIWTMLMHKILQNHLLCAFVANSKIDAIYALYPESFCDKNLAIRKVFAFCDSGLHSNKLRPELTDSRLTAKNAIRVVTRIVMFLVWPRPELSCVVTRNKTLSMYRNYMGLCLVFLLKTHFDCFV